ncbi:MAG: indole-3-glycerol-phosphate synthase [Patescibacteria group bacterium]
MFNLRPFHKALRGREKISVIAELKRRSPSHGAFPHHDIKTLVRAYENGGASALSVVTEPMLFDGSIELLREMRKHTSLPIIRKDFIHDTAQIDESAAAGANAVLLIARMLEQSVLKNLVAHAHKQNLDTVIELHDEADLAKIAGLEDIIIGINNRNLSTFTTDVNHAHKLLKLLPPKSTIIAESAFKNPSELALYKGKVDAVLIGTTFLTSKDPEETLTTFTHARRT